MVKKFLEQKRVPKDKSDFRGQKVIKKKGYNLHVEWKSYDNSFSWIPKT